MAYIDKELLLKDIYKNVRFSVKSGVISPELRGARKVIDRIENAPTADVVEVKHGEWVLLDECSNEGVYCSVCHKKVYRKAYANQKVKSNYCPNCGAKMDGRRDT